jgi:hypothetical protein
MLTLGASCVPTKSAKPPVTTAQTTDVLTVFLTGDELGALKPCGCSGGQLGGLDRRSAILKSVPKDRRLILDSGRFVDGDSEQDLIKFNIVIQALSLLDYDVVSLAKEDVEIAEELGLLNSVGSVLNVISAHTPAELNMPARFTKQYQIGNENVTVTVAAFDAESAALRQIAQLFPATFGAQRVNILIVSRCDSDTIRSIAKNAPNVDCLVCPSNSDEPMIIGDPNDKPLALAVGRFGRYVCRLQIKPAQSEGKLKLSFGTIAVEEQLPQEPSLVRLYKDYQQLVRQANLLRKHPRFALPNDLKYMGSESCKACHEYEYQAWSSKAHAHAYATLVKVGSQFDPECVVCHVVGMDYESGFISEQESAHLRNVGCENCHGPGSEHIRTLGNAKTTRPKSACLDCHTPEQSANYAGNEQLYLEKIVHWREPKAAGNVKN